ncbi:SDR family NAD(P)-dependent oxidoreductase [Gandjariella thermophila]|uniref:Short-chain dehydrogenase/reductase n=1 Tax=Gandjariella thermophila TaxID=1931992 RepID=A0A4D4J407_9PSEU|nr:SDR family NAD(P)-dependent oxidoreductase [Gandjariella thermophila]GDY29802.1 short-chain dehydrogenase/reductase [Gandjariella thermophila]
MQPPCRTALITGCSSGIGHALAEQLAARGLTVYATARDPETLADLAARGIRTDRLDVTDPDSVAAVRDRLRAAGERVELLVNNAGYGLMGPAVDIDPAELRHQFEVNVFGLLRTTQAFAPDMADAGGGRVVNVSSISAVVPTPFAGAYCASKAAVSALSDALRMELAPFGVQVITLEPGGVRSRFGDTARDRLALRDGSRYASITEAIERRASASQEGATPTGEFARAAAEAMLRPRPRAVVRLGAHSRQLPLLKRLLPNRVLDAVMARRFGLHQLNPR